VAAESVLSVADSLSFNRRGARGASGAPPVSRPDWDKMRIGDTGDVLEVPGNGTVIEIPWDRIRSIADPEFRAHLAEHAAQRARRIGERIRAMRREAGLSRVVLAEKSGMARDVLARLEAGKIEAAPDLIEHIALVLGRRLRDFADE